MNPEAGKARGRTALKKAAVASRRASSAPSGTGEGVGVRLSKRTPATQPIRLATLSWPVPADGSWGQSPEDFLATVAAANAACGACDLVVGAGFPVEHSPPAEEILNASGDSPVLFEAKRDACASWLLAHVRDGRPDLTLLRRRQVVTSFDQDDLFPVLTDIIGSGAGTIAFADADVRFVLFICGENNLLRSSRRASVVKTPPEDATAMQRLAAVLSGPWVMLNPAHNPYYPQIRSTGFAKVGVVRSKKGSAGPTLRRLVQARTRFGDGTETPVAVVHVNNYDAGRPETAEYAEAVFPDYDGRVRRVGPVVELPTGAEGTVRLSVFEVQPGRRRP